MNQRLRFSMLLVLLFFFFGSGSVQSQSDQESTWRQVAGDNLEKLESAIEAASDSARPHLQWLLEQMPDADLQTLSDDFLLEHVEGALEAWQQTPWESRVPESVFRDAILPYASVNERRDAWRIDFRQRFLPLVKEANSASEATAILNSQIFGIVGVKYSTKRPKADQSPYESMEAGLASCTGLSILLIDACRSVGIPARFVGTPLWSDNSGNHSWIEIWDGDWRFTGAAEPTGKELDRGWFSGRAAGAATGDPRNAIYAVSWSGSTHHFPMVWKPGDTTVGAIDVTSRYSKKDEEIPEDRSKLHVQVKDAASGDRIAASVLLISSADPVEKGESKDERFDSNDHLGFLVARGQKQILFAHLGDQYVFEAVTVDQAEETVTLTFPQDGDEKESTRALAALQSLLEKQPATLELVAELPISDVPLNKREANTAARAIWQAHAALLLQSRAEEMEQKVIPVGDLKMPFDFQIYGKLQPAGRSLYISLHGGGGAPAEINDQQWENQKKLYSPAEGIYLAPRAPTNTWNLWHQSHIDRAFDRLISNMIVFHQVDPNHVYLLGYSAGGDGVYQLAPRMADRWAAAAMMAGHPNDARPDSLRNLPFTLHMGANDSPYDRNGQAEVWKKLLSKLRAKDQFGYDHWVEIYAEKGHWMDREDAQAIPWLASKTRRLRPEKVVWLQDDVVHSRFYWLFDATPEPRTRVEATISGQNIEVFVLKNHDSLAVRLDDSMMDLNLPVSVSINKKQYLTFKAVRNIRTLAKTMSERGDPVGMFSSEISIPLAQNRPED